MSQQVVIDHALCSGYGNCVLAAPDVFELDDTTNLAHVLEGRPHPGDKEAVTEAQVDCPVHAILVDGT